MGTFEVIPAFSTIEMPKQTNWSPRVNGVADFRERRTALRAGFVHIGVGDRSVAASQNPAIGQKGHS